MISKTNYLNYLICPLYGWLAKYKPELLNDDEPLRMRQGQEVEKVAHGLFKKGVEVKGYGEAGSKETMKLIEKGASVIYQAQAMTDRFLARTDILVKRDDGWHLYEVKSSTEVKKKNVNDLKFQANVFKMVGVKLKSVNLIYVNKEYFFDKKKGLDLDQLFIVKNMTRKVVSGLKDELINMEKAYKVLTAKKRPVLSTLKKGFERDLPPLMEKEYYKGMPEYSIYRISGAVGRGKLEELTEKGIVDMRDIPADYPLTTKQWEQVNLTKAKGKFVDEKGIKLALDSFVFPLYFLDYEAISSPIPLYDGTRPWKFIAMQYSLHVLDEYGTLKHFEYLHTTKKPPFEAIGKRLREQIGDVGTLIAWHSSFEEGRNVLIGKMAPEYKGFMNDLNRRMVDLKLIFKDRYLDYRFKGRAGLKKVLPILVPKLSYDGLEIHGGMQAAEAIYDLVFGEMKNKKETEKWLLEYCDMDTLAMVRIYEELLKVAG